MRPCGAALLFAAGALALSLATATTATAEPVRVALVRPAAAPPQTTEALIHLRGELVADGFDVDLVAPASSEKPGETLPEALDPRDLGSPPGLRSAEPSPPPGPAAMVGVSLDPDARAAEIWIVDLLTNKRLTRRIDMSGEPPERVAQVLAIRCVELLRASLLELVIEEGRPSAPPEQSRKARRWAEQPVPALRRSTWGLEAGASVLVSPSQVGPAALFTGRLRWSPVQPVHVRLTFAGLGTSPRVAGPEGSTAAVSQSFGVAEVVWLPWPDLRVRPLLSLGAGVLRVSVDGQASFPYVGTHSAVWAGVADAGAGFEAQLVPHLGVAIEGHVSAATPQPVVRFLEEQAARGERPGVYGSATLVGWL